MSKGTSKDKYLKMRLFNVKRHKWTDRSKKSPPQTGH